MLPGWPLPTSSPLFSLPFALVPTEQNFLRLFSVLPYPPCSLSRPLLNHPPVLFPFLVGPSHLPGPLNVLNLSSLPWGLSLNLLPLVPVAGT